MYKALLKMKLQFFADGDNGDGGTPTPEPKSSDKLFTQEQLNEILQARLAKERKKLEAELAQGQKGPEIGAPEAPENNEPDPIYVKLQEEIKLMREEQAQALENLKKEKELDSQRNELKALGVDDNDMDQLLKLKQSLTEFEFNEYLQFKKSPKTNSVKSNSNSSDSNNNQSVSSDFIGSILEGLK